MARGTRGNNAQFTYDFGIAIAQSTVNKLARLTGATLTLASAFYALKNTANDYVDTLRENTLRFGGVLSTMQAMEEAQNRIISGQSRFSVKDQLEGMNQLMAAGVNVKKNLAWVEKAAHATGKSFSQFSSAISNAIAGNMGQLVEMGVLTQRATRHFDKYAANTVRRQQAIMNFLRTHKGLLSAIRNDFDTIQDQMLRLKEIWKAFLQSIVGKPNDPQSLYGQIVSSLRMVADRLAANVEYFKRIGYVIGNVLGWVIKQIGHFVVWLGRKMKESLSAVWKMTDNYVEFTRSLLVWLEFWKVAVIDFFKEYGWAIKGVLKLLLLYKALKFVFVIGRAAIMSVWAFHKALKATYLLQMRYIAVQGPYISKVARWFQSLAVWMPRPFRKAWVASGKYLANIYHGSYRWARAIGKVFRGLGGLIVAPFKFAAKVIPGLMRVMFGALTFSPKMFFKGFGQLKAGFMALINPIKSILGGLFKFIWGGLKSIWGIVTKIPKFFGFLMNGLKMLWNSLFVSNPVGWIILAIAMLVVLYKKSETFRVFINNLFKFIWEAIKLVWNLLYGAFLYCYVGIKNTWKWLKSHIFQPVADFFKKAWIWISEMWKKFKDTTVGKFIDKWIVQPFKKLFEWIMKAWNWLVKAMAKAVEWISGANTQLAKDLNAMAAENGLPQLAVSGNDYDTNDKTDYLSMDAFKTPSTKGMSAPSAPTPANPILEGGSGGSGGGTTNNTSISMSNGAITINVPKEANIDEQQLAKIVRREIEDMQRDKNMRGGKP